MTNWTYKNFTIHEFDELPSTNSHAFELANLQKISDREVILAHLQNQGRGRQNRVWSSPLGNLYFSLLLRPKISAEKIPQISFVAIAALKLAVKKILSSCKALPDVALKWPNDLLIEQKKIAGILLESKISEKNCEFVIVGIGLNIDSNPSSTIFPATNLKNFDVEISPQEALKIFLGEFENLYENYLNFGFAKTRQIWLENAFRLKEKISVNLGEKEICGNFEELDLEGNLLLKTAEKTVKISAGEILNF